MIEQSGKTVVETRKYRAHWNLKCAKCTKAASLSIDFPTKAECDKADAAIKTNFKTACEAGGWTFPENVPTCPACKL